MLRSEEDRVRRIVREEMDALLVELSTEAELLDMGLEGDVPVAVVQRLIRNVQAVRGLPDEETTETTDREEENDGG